MALLLKEAGLLRVVDGEPTATVNIIPLFETVADLDASAGVMSELFAPAVVSHPAKSRKDTQR